MCFALVSIDSNTFRKELVLVLDSGHKSEIGARELRLDWWCYECGGGGGVMNANNF